MLGKALALLIVVFSLLASGCNTMAGFGRDLEKLGDKIEDKAEEKKRY
jgi:entericidin A